MLLPQHFYGKDNFATHLKFLTVATVKERGKIVFSQQNAVAATLCCCGISGSLDNLVLYLQSN